MSSSPDKDLNLGAVKGFINQFGQEVGGVSTADISTAFKLDSKTKKPTAIGGITTVKATYETKLKMEVEFISSVDQISDDAAVMGIVDKVLGSGFDALAVGSDYYAAALLPAFSLKNENIASLGAKLISHELGHIFGLGHSDKGSMKTGDSRNEIGFTLKERTEMNRSLIGNWNDNWNKIKNNKSKPADLKFKTDMKGGFKEFLDKHGR